MALMNVSFFSHVLGVAMQMNVILPQRKAGEPSGKYPTLYLLHGMSDDHTIWQRRTAVERYVEGKNLAVVMPSVDLGWYTDMAHGNRYWTFISEELPAICRDFFPNMSTAREETFAAGLSMGGYGAMKLGLRAPDRFSKVASLSGAMNIAADGYDSKFFDDVFGPAANRKGSFNDLFAAADDLSRSGKSAPDIFMWCGTEDFLYSANQAMRDHLSSLGYNLTYQDSPGDHSWKYWDEKIKTVLDWLGVGHAG